MDELNNLFGGGEQLWQYIKHYAGRAGREATRVVLELYYVVMSPDTPTVDKTIIVAALGYQLLSDDRKILSREKYGLLGLLDNGAALALAYNRVKTRVTPQIENQVDAILNQWFGVGQPHIGAPEEPPRIPGNASGINYGGPQPATVPATPESPIVTNSPTAPLGGYSEDEDVVID